MRFPFCPLSAECEGEAAGEDLVGAPLVEAVGARWFARWFAHLGRIIDALYRIDFTYILLE